MPTFDKNLTSSVEITLKACTEGNDIIVMNKLNTAAELLYGHVAIVSYVLKELLNHVRSEPLKGIILSPTKRVIPFHYQNKLVDLIIPKMIAVVKFCTIAALGMKAYLFTPFSQELIIQIGPFGDIYERTISA